MVKLKHKHRRDGVILVGGSTYELDSDGCVEVTEEHAKKMLQGSLWRAPEHWSVKEKVLAESMPKTDKGFRRPRTKEELLAAAKAEGIEPKEEKPKLEEVISVTETSKEPVEEVIEVSLSMPKRELRKVATSMGLDVNGKTKAEILDMIEAQGD